jgi:hypothetical protein
MNTEVIHCQLKHTDRTMIKWWTLMLHFFIISHIYIIKLSLKLLFAVLNAYSGSLFPRYFCNATYKDTKYLSPE